jgi:hypothetical protein
MKTLRLKREQALGRRNENLKFWLQSFQLAGSDAAREWLQAKIDKANGDIANLKRKLGVV